VQMMNPARPLPMPTPTFESQPIPPAITPTTPNQERPF
jgi:hypothetical protein